eukprot:2434451-Prymnesium_polylepis.1
MSTRPFTNSFGSAADVLPFFVDLVAGFAAFAAGFAAFGAFAGAAFAAGLAGGSTLAFFAGGAAAAAALLEARFGAIDRGEEARRRHKSDGNATGRQHDGKTR